MTHQIVWFVEERCAITFLSYLTLGFHLEDDKMGKNTGSVVMHPQAYYIQVHLNKLECRGKVHLFQ